MVIDATVHIRQSEALSKEDYIPIVALTAQSERGFMGVCVRKLVWMTILLSPVNKVRLAEVVG